MSIDWGGTDDQMIANMKAYEEKVTWAIEQVALYFAPILEAAAKENAGWTDRTGNARQALAGYVDDAIPPKKEAEDAADYEGGKIAEHIVTVYLSHGMKYGRGLELNKGGAYAIIWPTIEEHLPQVEQMLKDIFK